VAQKNAQAEQAYYTVAKPQSRISKIRGERPIPFYSVAGIVVIYTSSYILHSTFCNKYKIKKKKKNKEEEVSVFCKCLCNDSSN